MLLSSVPLGLVKNGEYGVKLATWERDEVAACLEAVWWLVKLFGADSW